MELIIHQASNSNIAELKSTELLSEIQHFLDLIGNASYQEAYKIIIKQENLNADFFNLKTKFAGEVLQKFSNYNLRLAIVGDFSKIKSNSLNDFIKESNRIRRIVFVESIEEAFLVFNN